MYIQRIKQAFLNLSLTSKLKYIYTGLIFVCIFCNLLILYGFFSREMQKTLSTFTSQIVETVSLNVDNSLSVISKTSTYLLGTAEVQNYLQDTTYSDYVIRSRQLRNSLYLTLESMPLVSSIMIMQPSGVYEGAARYTLPSVQTDSPKDAPWYEELLEKKGAPLLTINGGGYLKFEDGKDYVTLIRLVNSTEDVRPLGYLFINISVDSLLSFAREDSSDSFDFYVSSGEDIIFPFFNSDLNIWLDSVSVNLLPDKSQITVGHDRYLLLKFQTPSLDWNYIAAINYHIFTNQNRAFLIISVLILLISIAFFLLIALCTNRFVTAPLYRLMNAMKRPETGDFNHAYVTPYHDEIGRLQNAYNDMVDKIQQLLESKVLEQKKLRKAELSVLQEQIKPHFLYNSLGAISYLVTSQQNEKAYDMLISLSEYYRESLSKGSEIIPLSTEINIVKNYLKLQKVRFPDTFTDEYELSEEALSYRIPRLILQPLVENSLYHGIIPTCDSGVIKICAFTDANYLVIRVIDNGIGMTQSALNNIFTDKTQNPAQSFGLKGTIERMQIFYETQDICAIESRSGEGTAITFSIPLNQ
ncbi:MAG: histidine kinase [Clostridium sp.]|nr:histidine kinase [Clostridium sp.]